MSHTPGPWVFHGGPDPYIWGTGDFCSMMIAQIRGWGHLTGDGALGLDADTAAGIQDANGALLAAAPELLAACELALSYVCAGRDNITGEQTAREVEADIVFVRDAIAKAKGG